jgi:hypothetical protein
MLQSSGGAREAEGGSSEGLTLPSPFNTPESLLLICLLDGESKSDPPAPADSDGPCASPLAFELMEISPGRLMSGYCVGPSQVHVKLRTRTFSRKTLSPIG